ncbi:MAG: class I SAM-dependent methyltransferase [Opitutae bacterium]|nr:class I SAM-dependent methyltransferase [Opitutae bacterium]
MSSLVNSTNPFTASMQGQVWGARARDWVDVQEPAAQPLYETALLALDLPAEASLLDAGCGGGLFCALAANRGYKVTGVDAAPRLIEIAQRRVPGRMFLQCDLEELPFGGSTHFDAVLAFNSLQYTRAPLKALGELHRVLKPGGRLVLTTWAEPAHCEGAACLQALAALLPPQPANAPGAFAFAPPGIIADLTARAGFTPVTELTSKIVWDYPDEATALRGLLSAGPAVRAVRHAGEPAATAAVKQAIAPFKEADGHYRLRNVIRCVIVAK